MRVNFVKLSIVIVLLSFGYSQKINAQSNPQFGAFLDENFEGGEDKFLHLFYENINYPSNARNNCGIGHLHIRLTLSPTGSLKEIMYLNPFGYGVEQDVTEVLKKTSKGWKKMEKEEIFEFSIAYQLCESPQIKGDINVIGYGVDNPAAQSGCQESEALLWRIKTLIEKEKFKKIPNIWYELVRRGYRGEEFLKLKEVYGETFTAVSKK